MNMKVIIIGAGEVGYHIAYSLSCEGIDTVVIDRNEERLHEISEALDVQTVLGSGSSPEVLKRACMMTFWKPGLDTFTLHRLNRVRGWS